MRKIQRRKSDFMVKRQLGSAAYPQFKGIGAFSQQAKMRRVYTGALLANLQKKKGFQLWLKIKWL